MEHYNYFPLLVVFAISWTIPLILSWLEIGKVPSVIVEIVAGVLVGPFVLKWVTPDPLIDFLAGTGFLFLIFLAGLEMDGNKIISSFPKRRIHTTDLVSNPFLMACLIYAGALILAMPFSLFLFETTGLDFWFGTILLPTAAIGIILPILKSEGSMNQRYGQTLLMEGAIATIMSIILISIYSGILKNGFRVELLLFGIIFIVFFATYHVGVRLFRVRTFQVLLYRLEHAASQIKVRGAVALLLLFVVIAHIIDTELIMGAFFAGALLSLFVNKERSALMFKLDGMSYGFFIPIFFVMVGVNLDLSALSQFQDSIPFILLLTAGFFIVQLIPSLVMVPLFGFKKSMAGGMLLTARLGETIATAQIALTLGIISGADNAGIVTASILTCIISPIAYNLISPISERRPHLYVLGGSRASLILAERINMHGMSCLNIIQNQAIKHDFEEKSVPFKFVEDLRVFAAQRLKLRTSDLVIILTESRLLTLDLARVIKNELGHGKMIMRMQAAAHDLIHDEDIKLIDQDEVLANHVEDLIVRPDSVKSITHSFENYGVEEIHVHNHEILGKRVKDINWPKSGSLVIHRRNNEVFIPHGDTHLMEGDLVTVIGNKEALIEFRRTLA